MKAHESVKRDHPNRRRRGATTLVADKALMVETVGVLCSVERKEDVAVMGGDDNKIPGTSTS